MKAQDIFFDRSSFEGRHGEATALSPLIRRVLARNAGPMTFTGTCTYVVGRGEVAVIDPGPERPDHIAALLDALRGETVTAILVTHSHKDHSQAARALSAATGARIAGCAPSFSGSGIAIDAAHSFDYEPNAILHEGDAIEGKHFSLVCVETPGHTKNHLAFALPQEKALFTGDHIMAWSTTVIAPPDGSMRDYVGSLQKLLGRDDNIYLPGHGGPVREPHPFVRTLIEHRRMREQAILAHITAGDSSIATIVGNIYRGLDPALINAAAFSVLAHIEDMVERGLVVAEGTAGLDGIYRLASNARTAGEE